MSIEPFRRLLAVSGGLRLADQLVVAGVPLVAAAVFDLPDGQIGAMIAAQGAAWLIMSLPAGVLTDRIAPFVALARATVVACAGCAIAAFGLLAGLPWLFAFGAFLSTCATVLALLAEGASVQRLIPGPALGAANARIQILQSAAMLAGPAAMGLLVARGAALAGFALALTIALIGFVLARGFPEQSPPPPRPRDPWREIREGFGFVSRQPLLRGIVFCALFWNMGFMGLAAIYVPFAIRALSLDPEAIGLAQSSMGIGSLGAAFAASWAMRRLPPRALLVFGPASSTLASALLIAAPGGGAFLLSAAAYALLGFGPIIWFVCQNTIRQLVTPPGMLGRVGAVIQLGIYGIRSLGALLGGWIAARHGAETALAVVMALFVLSTLVIPLSALGRLRSMPDGAGSPA